MRTFAVYVPEKGDERRHVSWMTSSSLTSEVD
jgi:hypothetical protein